MSNGVGYLAYLSDMGYGKRDNLMNSIQFLDEVKRQHQIPSDNKLAQFLGFPQGQVAKVRTGSRKIDGKMALAIAKALDEPPEYVIAEIQVERATQPDLRRVWKSLARMAKQNAAQKAQKKKKATFK